MKEYTEERLPVWVALSDLFWRKYLTVSDWNRISDILVRSSYSMDELREILFYEVYPACRVSLFFVDPGYGFYPEWIMEHIAPRKDKRSRFRSSPLHKWIYRHHWAIRRNWGAVSKLVERRRALYRYE